jgi:nucleoporin NUP159
VDPFGSEKAPHHSILRLKDFPPGLQDLLIVSSTATIDIGLVTRSKTPLTPDKPADAITNVFTTTELADDTKRASLPMSEEMDNTVPIGVALDLSGKDKVYKPIPTDELEESPGPVPGYWVLNNEGILCSWWLIYTDSIRQGTTYPGMAAVAGAPTSTPTPATAPAAGSAFSNPSAPTFGQTSTSAFGQTSKPTFGQTSTPAFGQTSTPSFGGSSGLGAKTSPWGTPSATSAAPTGGAIFGSTTFRSTDTSGPTFGKPSALSFGQSSSVGLRPSPWASSSTASPAFGQSGFAALGGEKKSVFGSPSMPTPAPSTGGFAGFVNQGGFASVGSSTTGNSVFGSKPAGSSFVSKPSDLSMDTDTAFPPPKPDTSNSSPFSQPFKLGTTFKADPPSKDDDTITPSTGSGSSMFGTGFGLALGDAAKSTQTEKPQDTGANKSIFSQPSTTPTTTPAPAKFGFVTASPPKSGIFGQPSILNTTPSSIFKTPEAAKPNDGPKLTTPEIKVESGDRSSSDAPLPPESTSKATYPLGDSSSSSGTGDQSFDAWRKTPSTNDDAPLPPDFLSTPKPPKAADAPLPPDFLASAASITPPSLPKQQVVEKPRLPEAAPLPPDFINKSAQSIPSAPLPPDPIVSKAPPKPEAAPLPPDFLQKPISQGLPPVPSIPDESEESDFDDESSEGSGTDVAKDISPSTAGFTQTPGFTPQASSVGMTASTFSLSRQESDAVRPLFGEIARNAPVLGQRQLATSPRSPSPVRNAIPSRVIRPEAPRSVSAPGMASQILGASRRPQSRLGQPIIGKEAAVAAEDPFILQQRKNKARQEAEETQPLVDEEDEEIQRILSSRVQGSLVLDEFIAHSNVVPPAKESIPSQVEAVYRDINSMIDTLGLNARALKGFVRGHSENSKPDGRTKDDLEIPDDWVLCEVDQLGDILDNDLAQELEDGRVQDFEEKMDTCHELLRDLGKLRARQSDLRHLIEARFYPDQAEILKALPLSAEQVAQQNDLRREYANFTKLLAEAEEALTILKAKIASSHGASGKGGSSVPTIDAVMRTITKMTSMVEKRSGDIDVLENQMRKLRFSSVASREGSPITPQKKSSIFSPEPGNSGTPKNLRHSLSSSVTSFGARGTPPRKKLSGFSKEEKGGLMSKRARRQAVLDKLRENIERSGVNVWAMEDID